MPENRRMDEIRGYFQDKLDTFGNSPRGADWNSPEAQNTRFEQLSKVIQSTGDFTVLDYGCGYGACADYLLNRGLNFSHFYGYDILQSAVDRAAKAHPQRDVYTFTTELASIPEVDYTLASGVFNIRLDMPYEQWTDYVLESLEQINKISRKGFASNFLTSYSDPEKMAERLYYADPCRLFDYCKKHFSRNVAILHDYGLYDFTLIVRKL
jgi:SAM-dependent methyltransferase